MAEDPGVRVLLVDDNQDNLAVLARRLQRRGYVVSLAQSGLDALQYLRGQPTDLIVLDIMMPGMDGLEVLRRIRADRGMAHIAVIMATAKAASQDMVQALEQGADDYVSKPIDFEVLLARIRAVLRRRGPTLPSPKSAAATMPTASAVPLPANPSPGVAAPSVLAKPSAPPASPVSPRKIGVGSVLDGRYRLDVLIGSGGFGAVYKGTHLVLDNTVAIKVLHPQVAESLELRRRFQQEGVSSCRVRHPNAVTVFDAGTSDGVTPYLVMEYLDGFTLEALLRQEGALPLSRTAHILVQVCDVLLHAHASDLVHRDIKPANLFLSQTVHGEVVKVLDFGLAKLLHNKESVELSGTRNLMGTPQFMAPERLTGEPSDHRVDIYAVGATLYLALAGAMPHGLTEKNIVKQMRKQLTQPLRPIQELAPTLPPALAKLIMGALAREPGQRPSLAALQAELLRHTASSAKAPPMQAKPGDKTRLELDDTLTVAPPVSSDALSPLVDDRRRPSKG
ncbi:MAG: response regulator [Myxococcales bacterium]|nr:response regulator [Myxococcales bacterium]